MYYQELIAKERLGLGNTSPRGGQDEGSSYMEQFKKNKNKKVIQSK